MHWRMMSEVYPHTHHTALAPRLQQRQCQKNLAIAYPQATPTPSRMRTPIVSPSSHEESYNMQQDNNPLTASFMSPHPTQGLQYEVKSIMRTLQTLAEVEVTQCKEQIRTLLQSNHSLRLTHNKLLRKTEFLEMELSECHADIAELEDELTTNQRHTVQVERMLEAAREETKRLDEKLTESQNYNAQLEKQVMTMQRETQETIAKLKASHSTIREQELTIEALQVSVLSATAAFELNDIRKEQQRRTQLLAIDTMNKMHQLMLERKTFHSWLMHTTSKRVQRIKTELLSSKSDRALANSAWNKWRLNTAFRSTYTSSNNVIVSCLYKSSALSHLRYRFRQWMSVHKRYSHARRCFRTIADVTERGAR
eukprot:PhF_6_TR3692/c0_g2_i1/m.5255